MNNKKNLLSALLYQVVFVIYGLVVPRLILGSFGSEVNGLVSSITQFLGFISLLEGGLGAVVLAELYKPIEDNDYIKIKGILYSCQHFFKSLAIIFVIYTVVLSAVYSLAIRKRFEITFTISLIIILSLTTIAQYLFSITIRLYLQADQKIYIINHVTTITLVINTIIAIVVIKVFPDIRVLKLLSSIAFFVQPLIYRQFIPKELLDYNNDKYGGMVLKNRWSGFAQNLAHYVNMNTDVVLITLFCTLSEVSVYTVYMFGINAIRLIISYLTNSYQSALGKYIVQDNKNALNSHFKDFCIYTWGAALALFCTCLLVINPFVSVYTKSVHDANYYQPMFALLIVLANLIYCLREPYRLLILAAGKFKETNFGSIMEALLNIGISLALIKPLGLVGVALGTLIAIAYRMAYFILFVKEKMIKLYISDYIKYIVTGVLIIVANIVTYTHIKLEIDSFVSFTVLGAVILFVELGIITVVFFGLDKSKRLVDWLLRSR